MALVLTNEFKASYGNFKKYPVPLVSKVWYGHSFLELCRERYEARQEELFVGSADEVKIPVRDIKADGTVYKENLFKVEKLKQWLGDSTWVSPLDPANVKVSATKKDPPCRFVYLISRSQTAPLEACPEFLNRILTWHQVMPSFLDFLDAYGSKYSEDREIHFSSFRSEMSLGNPQAGLVMPEMNRSGNRYQICYNLKAVVPKDEDPFGPVRQIWKIRQAAIYHQFDVEKGTQLWLLADPHAILKGRVEEVYHQDDNHKAAFSSPDAAFESSHNIHHLFCRWAEEGWKPHVQSMEQTVHALGDHLIGPLVTQSKHQPGAVGRFQAYEDIINDSIMALESNADNMTSLQTFYEKLLEDSDFPAHLLPRSRKMISTLAAQLKELIYHCRMLAARAKVLRQTAANRKTLLIQYLQAEVATRQEDFTAAMWSQAERASDETIAMRIIAIITLLFLPPTFASAFFSTEVLKYETSQDVQPGQKREKFSLLALERFLELTLPLWFITFSIAGLWWLREQGKRKTRHEELKTDYPDVFARLSRQTTFGGPKNNGKSG